MRIGSVLEADLTLVSATLDAGSVVCTIAPSPSDFSVVSCPGSVPGNGGTATVVLSFAPGSRGARAASLTIDYDLAGVPMSEVIDLGGVGIAPEMVVTIVPASPEPLDFGGAVVGSASPTTYMLLIDNDGDDMLQVSLTEGGRNPGDWSYEPAETSFSIPADGSRTITTSFVPTASGPRTAIVTLRDADGLSTASVRTFSMTGSGRAPRLAVSPGALAFGTIRIGTESAPRPVTISNTGDADLTITSVAIPGDNAEDYRVDFGAPVTLGPGEDVVVDVAFRPQALGAQDAVLVVESDSPTPPTSAQVALSGNGDGTPMIAVSPAALTFGAVDVQTGDPVRRSVAVTNLGDGALDITGIRLDGLDGQPYTGDQFVVLTAAPLVVPPGEERTIEVSYDPAFESAGDYAVLVLETDVPAAPEVEVTLSGRGLDRHIAVSDQQIAFGPTYRNPGDPPSVELVVENTGESPLVLNALILDGEGADSFVLVGALDGEIEPMTSSTLVIEFHPRSASEEPIAATMFLVNDDDDRPMVRIDLSGLGILPPIDPSYTSIDWGSVAVGLDLPPPGRTPFLLHNDSAEDSFVIQEVRVVDEAGEPMEAVRAAGLFGPVELGPGQDLVLDVAFAPREGGEFRGVIEVLVDADPVPVVRVPVGGIAVGGSVKGGGGCAAGPGSGSSGSGSGAWAIGALVLLLGCAVGRRRAAGAAGLALLLAGGAARAQDIEGQNIDLASFRPAYGIDPEMVTVESSEVGATGSFAVDLSLGYARNPLVVESDAEMVDRPVSMRTTTELAAAFAFGDRFEVCAVVPFLAQDGDDPMWSGIQPAGGPALGDFRLRGKAYIGALDDWRFGTAAELTLPTGVDVPFAGSAGPSAHARGLADYRSGRIHVAINAGGLMRARVRLADVDQGHEATYGVAAAVQATPRLSGVAELFGGIGLGGGPTGTRPLEAVLAGRYRVTRAVGLLAGVGRGLLAGVGAPELRVFVGIGWSPGARPIVAPGEDPALLLDDDKDGIAARDDRCPEAIEDVDGFEDVDGCPDPDDDGDRVADGFDRCPRVAEDPDGFEDGDGCPELDNDADGVADRADRCPGEAEDRDQFEDGDGCPELDNDGDGVPDTVDRCPAEPETINGNQDDDGCADPGEGLVQVTATRVEVFERIRFRGDTAALTRTTQRALGQVAATLRATPRIRRLRIRAHVHARGAGDDELSVQRAEAVRRWLVEWGIAAERLEGAGFGSRHPLVTGNSARSRSLNDRVELEIVEHQAP